MGQLTALRAARNAAEGAERLYTEFVPNEATNTRGHRETVDFVTSTYKTLTQTGVGT